MKDKILQFDNGNSYYVIEEITHNNKNYALTLPCDVAKDEVDEENLVLMELRNENGVIVPYEIPEDELALEIFQKIENKIQGMVE